MKFLFKTFLISMTCLSLESPALAADVIHVYKVDTKHYGLANLILYEKKNEQIALKLNGDKVVEYEVTRKTSKVSTSVRYIRQNNKFKFLYGFATSSHLFYNEQSCQEHQDTSFSLSGLAALSKSVESKSFQLDSTCDNSPMKDMLNNEFGNLTSNKDDIAACVGKYDPIAEMKWRNLPSSLTKVFCEDSSKKYSGLYDSKINQIHISNSCVQAPKEFPAVLREEILHSFGIKDETLAKCAAKCPGNIPEDCKKAITLTHLKDNNSRTEYIHLVVTDPDGSISQKVADDYNSGKTIEVPREIAVAQVPQPQVADLKMNSSVESYTVTDTPSGPASGEASAGRSYSSVSYPNSMMQFASSAILPEKAYAASDSSSGSGSVSASSRSTSSANDSSGSGSKWNASTSATYGAEMARRQAAERAPASDSSLMAPAYSSSANPVNERDSSASSKNNLGSARLQARGYRGSPSVDGSSASASSGGGFSSGNSGAGSANANRSARAPASVISNASEMTHYFQTTPYPEIKRRLQDPSFIQDLKRNSTTVYDTQGHRFGANQGQIIFSDKGNRFVKEK